MKKKETVDAKVLTANELTNVRDINKGVLYTKNGYAISMLRIFPVNIDLLSESEKEGMTNSLTAEFKGEKNCFSILGLPRTLDMEMYINFLTDAYEQEIMNPNRKKLLNIMLRDATKKVMSGANFEHQFFLLLWERIEKGEREGQAEQRLLERIEGFMHRYEAVNTITKRLEDTEILKVCNQFGNSDTALFESYEENMEYTPMPWIGR